jgi:hypothetical protein
VLPEMTASELAAALLEDPDAGVELRVLDANGDVLVDNVVRFSVTPGHDIDRTGVYRWLVITGQLEPRTIV